MNRRVKEMLFALLPAALLAGCAEAPSQASRPVYSSSQTGQVITQERGMVVAVEEVLIKAPSSSAGSTGAGAQIGSAVVRGAMTGSSNAIAGAVGGILGSKAGANLDNQVGDKITVQLDNGKTVVIVQARGSDAPIMPGERVAIETGSSQSVYGGGTSRVIREAPTADPPYVGAQPTAPKRVW